MSEYMARLELFSGHASASMRVSLEGLLSDIRYGAIRRTGDKVASGRRCEPPENSQEKQAIKKPRVF